MNWFPYVGAAIALCWIVFAVVWLVTSLFAKRNVKRGKWWQTWWNYSWWRIVIIVILYLLLRNEIATRIAGIGGYQSNFALGIIGVVLTVIGVAFAFWARFSIGTNWGMPMTLKENRELVTRGPYHFVRHPIYTGVMLALVGTAVAISLWWLTIIVIYFAFFLYSARTEERMLTQEFPEAYPAYKKRTKMLIPFVL